MTTQMSNSSDLGFCDDCGARSTTDVHVTLHTVTRGCFEIDLCDDCFNQSR